MAFPHLLLPNKTQLLSRAAGEALVRVSKRTRRKRNRRYVCRHESVKQEFHQRPRLTNAAWSAAGKRSDLFCPRHIKEFPAGSRFSERPLQMRHLRIAVDGIDAGRRLTAAACRWDRSELGPLKVPFPE